MFMAPPDEPLKNQSAVGGSGSATTPMRVITTDSIIPRASNRS